MLKAKAGSTFSAGKRQLYDAYGKPLIDVEAKMVSLHSTWLLKRSADGSRLADVKLVRSMFSKSEWHLVLTECVALVLRHTCCT